MFAEDTKGTGLHSKLPENKYFPFLGTESVTDLDYRSEMIIFESILTFFKLSVVFRGSWGSCVNWLEPKIDPPSVNLVCPNP